MSVRRFTRLTNAFSKKPGNHMHATSLYFTRHIGKFLMLKSKGPGSHSF